MMKSGYRFFIGTILLLGLVSCSREPKLKNAHLMSVVPQSVQNALFYSGTILPLKTTVVTSPADGVIIDMPFQYGETVKSGQLLYVLSSAKFLADYKTALMQYIKAKSDYNTSQTQLSEAEFLHKHELISDDEFKTKQSNFYASQLTLVQSKDALELLIRQLDLKEANLYKLTIADIDKITQAMHLQMNSESLRITAPANGVLLSANKNDDESKRLSKGDNIKQGEVLAVIGDMSGVSVHIKVNELTVNQLHPGQKVKVTGIAFPEQILFGQISRVDRQGETSNGAIPAFGVDVVVPKLSLAQQNEIHVGMSAKVEIDVDESQQMMIPISAVSDKDGTSFVKRFDPASGNIVETNVKTGKTTPDAVAILAGLKPGDKIVIPD